VFNNFPTGGALRVDGVLIPRDLSLIFGESKQNQIDLLIGSNHDEATFFGPGVQEAKVFIANAKAEYGELADEFLKLYPATSDEQANASYLRSFSDEVAWHMRLMAAHQRQTGNNAWVYYMTYVPPGFESRGATHTAELAYMFNLRPSTPGWSEFDERLADQMSSYWVNFARTGNPNGDELPAWPLFESNNPGNVFVFGNDVEMEITLIPDDQVLEFFDSVFRLHRRGL
jgi:para-nitrobenzyl esterase